MKVVVTNLTSNELSTGVGILDPFTTITVNGLDFYKSTKLIAELNVLAAAKLCTVATTDEATDTIQELTTASSSAAFAYWRYNRVTDGLYFTAGTTPTSQATGAVAFVPRANIIEGNILSHNLQAGFTVNQVTNTTILGTSVPVLTSGNSVMCAVIGYWLSGAAAALTGIYGTQALTGSQVAPTDTVIRAALVTAGCTITNYTRICMITYNRTGATTITESFDNTWRDW